MHTFERFQKQIVLHTPSVPQEIERLAKEHKVHPQTIDFELLQAFTLTRKSPQSEFSPCNETPSPEELLDPALEIKQHYQIRFMPALSPAGFKFALKLRADPAKSYAEALIQPGSFVVPALSEKTAALSAYFNRLKLKNGLLVNLCDDEMNEGIEQLIRTAAAHPAGRLQIPFKLVLARWPQPVPACDDALHFSGKSDPVCESKARIDYADRHFCQSVQAGELLAEYRLPKEGRAGRNYFGAYLGGGRAQASCAPVFGVDEGSVEIERDARAWRYWAKTDGYVSMEGNVLKIEQLLCLPRIGLKETGHVQADLNRDVNIRVKADDPAEESVGSGMRLQAKRIVVEGSVGSHALLRAHTIRVAGMVHQSARLEAEEIDVGVLRGDAAGRHVRVESLEGGRILEARTAKITRMLGGEVSAAIITAAEVKGNATLRAHRHLEIGLLAGNNNRLFIDATAAAEGQAAAAEAARIETQNEALTGRVEMQARKIERLRPLIEQHLDHLRSGRYTLNTLPSAMRALILRFRDKQDVLKELIAEQKTLASALLTQQICLEAHDARAMEAKIVLKDGPVRSEFQAAWFFYNRPGQHRHLDTTFGTTGQFRFDAENSTVAFEPKKPTVGGLA